MIRPLLYPLENIIMIAIVDCRIPEPSRKRLCELGTELISLPRADYLDTPVSAHPDMLIFMGWGKLFCHARYFEKNTALLQSIAQKCGLDICLSDEDTGANYPRDVLFNCVILGEHLLCNTKTVSRLILSEAQSRGMNIIHTNQGYTKCSVCRVSDNAIITADISIYTACKEHGIDALLVSADGVALSGYDCGFIGGATGTHGECVYFCGDVSLHPDGEKIVEFCKNHSKLAVSLSSEGLYDIGSILFI